RPGNFFQNRP
nr:Chain E, p1-p6 peptide [Human immunodeficiency virus 1]4OBD_F Chain F, p1-p6 peptide [Human immunodeficiency virus 1]4OBK_C Chain C, p1-p6 peptide [Human immunodeficiency virus 1]